MDFPILTFEQGALSPSLGYVFREQWVEPYESIVGILWKFAKANALPGHLLLPQLIANPFDPYEGVEPVARELNVKRVAGQLGLLQKTVHRSLTPADKRRRAHSPILRYCLKCLRLGYHGVIHQRLGVQQCPIHGDWLEEVCRSCGERTDYRLNVTLLDAPFRCGQCRRILGHWSSLHYRPLNVRYRVAATRAYLRL